MLTKVYSQQNIGESVNSDMKNCPYSVGFVAEVKKKKKLLSRLYSRPSKSKLQGNWCSCITSDTWNERQVSRN